jgi:hypothetical protein
MPVVSSTLRDICFDAADPLRIARFWAEVLGYTIPPFHEDDTRDEVVILPPEGSGGMRIWFNRVPEPRSGKNRVHIDINMPDSEEMDRLLRLGATPLQEIRDEDGVLEWTIMADPEGNEFCAFPPR